MKQILIILFITVLIVSPVAAQERPTAEETRNVITYYYEGQGSGAVLMDHKLCQEIGQEGPDKNECINAIDPGQITQDQELFLWMSYLVPSETNADIIVTFSRREQVRRTASVKLTSATRFRTWKKIPTNKTGLWTVAVIQEMADKDLDLGSLQYTVSQATAVGEKP